MNRKLNLANVIHSVLVGLTLLFLAVRPASVSASDWFIQDGVQRSVHSQTGKLSFLGANRASLSEALLSLWKDFSTLSKRE